MIQLIDRRTRNLENVIERTSNSWLITQTRVGPEGISGASNWFDITTKKFKERFMSRHIFKRDNLEIAYGSDEMTSASGYFFQVFDSSKISKKNEEGLIVNEGFTEGISSERMIELMNKYLVEGTDRITNYRKMISEGLPI